MPQAPQVGSKDLAQVHAPSERPRRLLTHRFKAAKFIQRTVNGGDRHMRRSTRNARQAGRAKLTGALTCAVVVTCSLAHGQPVETIGRLPCGQLTTETLAAQPWSADGQPFGLPISNWTGETFQTLRARIMACHADKPAAAVRSLIRHVDHLEEHTKPILGGLAQQRERAQRAETQPRKAFSEPGEAESKARLRELAAEIRALPLTAEAARKLRELLSNNNYRLAELTFPDQNTYHQVISAKLDQASSSLVDAKCAPVVSKLNVPTELDGAVILTPVGSLSLTQFLCAAAVSTGRASIGPAPRNGEGLYALKIMDLTLIFELGRYAPQAGAFFPPSSPVQQGVKAVSLRSATTPDGPIPVDRGFIVNLHAQFTPQMATFLAQ